LNDLLVEVDSLDDHSKPIFFVDDNFFANKIRVMKIMRSLREKKIKWWTQADVTIMRHDDLLELAAESGCIYLVVGFETLSDQGLQAINKKHNSVEMYEAFIKKLQSYGILVNPSFSFGHDCETPKVFEDTLSFLHRNVVAFATFNILTPLPATPLFLDMKKQDRLLDASYELYNMGNPIFRPAQMSCEELKNGYNWICKEFYSLDSIRKRINTLRGQSIKIDLSLVMMLNLGYKRMLDIFGTFV